MTLTLIYFATIIFSCNYNFLHKIYLLKCKIQVKFDGNFLQMRALSGMYVFRPISKSRIPRVLYHWLSASRDSEIVGRGGERETWDKRDLK